MTLDPTKHPDWKIAQDAESRMKTIEALASEMGLEGPELLPYGHYTVSYTHLMFCGSSWINIFWELYHSTIILRLTDLLLIISSHCLGILWQRPSKPRVLEGRCTLNNVKLNEISPLLRQNRQHIRNTYINVCKMIF